MNIQIPRFLQEQLLKKSCYTNLFPDEIKKFMIKYARYYNWQLDDNLKRIIIAMRQGVTNLPRCSYKDCSKSVYFDVNTKLTTGC